MIKGEPRTALTDVTDSFYAQSLVRKITSLIGNEALRRLVNLVRHVWFVSHGRRAVYLGLRGAVAQRSSVFLTAFVLRASRGASVHISCVGEDFLQGKPQADNMHYDQFFQVIPKSCC